VAGVGAKINGTTFGEPQHRGLKLHPRRITERSRSARRLHRKIESWRAAIVWMVCSVSIVSWP